MSAPTIASQPHAVSAILSPWSSSTYRNRPTICGVQASGAQQALMLLSTAMANSLTTARPVRFPSVVWPRIPSPDRSNDCVIVFDVCVDSNCAGQFSSDGSLKLTVWIYNYPSCTTTYQRVSQLATQRRTYMSMASNEMRGSPKAYIYSPHISQLYIHPVSPPLCPPLIQLASCWPYLHTHGWFHSCGFTSIIVDDRASLQ